MNDDTRDDWRLTQNVALLSALSATVISSGRIALTRVMISPLGI